MTCIFPSDEHLTNFIERFGKKPVISMFETGLYISDEYLLEYGFNKKILSVVRGHIKRGKMPMHINKTNGKIKKQFHGYFLKQYVIDMKVDQLPENKAILMRFYYRFYEAYVVRYKKKFEGIDLETDPITFEPIVEPVYIKTDWDKNCKIVYSLDTIHQFCVKEKEYIGWEQDETRMTLLYINHYISPFTRYPFNKDDIIIVKMDRLKN